MAFSPSWQPDPPSTFSFAKAKKNKQRGTARLGVRVPGSGEVDLAKTNKVKPASKRAAGSGNVQLKIKPKGKAKKQLRKRGKAKVRAKVTYTPDGGEPNTRSKRLTLKKRQR